MLGAVVLAVLGTASRPRGTLVAAAAVVPGEAPGVLGAMLMLEQSQVALVAALAAAQLRAIATSHGHRLERELEEFRNGLSDYTGHLRDRPN